MNIYYFAYGTNLNKKIFLKKFKEAKVIGKYSLNNFKVVFRTKYKIPDLKRKLNSKVPGVIYKINKDIEKKLDKYEEYPKIYIKKYFKYKNKKSKEVKPSGYYFKIMMQGYQQNNFKLLNTFLKHR